MTNTKFHQLESSHNTAYNTLNQKIMDLKQHSEIIENDTLLNVNKEFQNIQKNVSMALADLELHIKDNSRKVAVTSCVSNEKTYNTGTSIKFDNVRTSIEIKNLSTFKSTGKFSCEVEGLYHISVYIVSYTARSEYSIYKNNNKLTTTYSDTAGHIQTSAGAVVMKMNVGDTIFVIPDFNMHVYADHWSCITTAMIK
ncbi:C1QG [Mytilus edulis]|uniref:C1QG n=1 Tax=Mytilus edulis TaxID=6550 RepID=A0A8S3S2P3_MYTED|nr:C1QG [Mytilus edulis]